MAGVSRTSVSKRRRSIYIFAKRSLAVPELELLDAPDTTGSCDRRMVSTTGPQALTFLNGLFIHQQANAFASRLIDEAGPDDLESRYVGLSRWRWVGRLGRMSSVRLSNFSRNKGV